MYARCCGAPGAPSTSSIPNSFTWPVTSALYAALWSSYGSQLIAELFGSRLQSFQALLAVPLFVCRNPFVHVGLSLAQGDFEGPTFIFHTARRFGVFLTQPAHQTGHAQLRHRFPTSFTVDSRTKLYLDSETVDTPTGSPNVIRFTVSHDRH
jgi:hypothetical protein